MCECGATKTVNVHETGHFLKMCWVGRAWGTQCVTEKGECSIVVLKAEVLTITITKESELESRVQDNQ